MREFAGNLASITYFKMVCGCHIKNENIGKIKEKKEREREKERKK